MGQHPVNEFGFKRLSLENWLTVDPVWGAFVMSQTRSNPSDAWVQDLIDIRLSDNVPLPIRKLFETARGTLAYSLMFYPLLTLGTEQAFRTMEAAVSEKYKSLGAPAKKRTFADKIDWLSANGAISAEQRPRWDAIRHLRNGASHPADQTIYSPGIALNVFDGAVELINELFV